MAYDSATPTALALRAYERANLTQQARRARLKQGYGLNDDGTLDSMGSIYQTNLGSVRQEQSAALADRARGFGGTGGLAGKRSTQAHEDSLSTQAGTLRDAYGNIAETTQGEQDNKGIYEDSLTQIRANADNDYAQSLIDNPVQVPQSAPDPAAAGRVYPPALVKAQMAALKKNPRIAQTARNRY